MSSQPLERGERLGTQNLPEGGETWRGSGSAQQTESRLADNARHAAAQARQAARQQMSQVTDQARAYAQERIEQGKQMTCEELSHAASALRAAADKLREEQDERLASYTDALADNTDSLVRYLREHNLSDLAREARGLVRQQPEWVLGGLFLAGLAIGRFFKASDPGRDASETSAYGPPSGWAPESGEPMDRGLTPPHSPTTGPASVTGTSTI